MSHHRNLSATAVAAALLAAALGCSEADDTVQVHGQVTYRDEPLTDGAVTFFPVEGRSTVAPLGDDGQYSCRLVPGDYKVTVAVGAELPPGWQEGDPWPKQDLVLPPHYTMRARTPLEATVSTDESEPIDFSLN